MGTTVEKVTLAYSVITEFDSLTSSISCNIGKLITFKVRQLENTYFLRALLSLAFSVWLYTHIFIYKSAQEGLVFYIISYRKTILDMQLQYVYCTCNSNSQSGKAMHSVKQSTSGKHRIQSRNGLLRLWSPTPLHCR